MDASRAVSAEDVVTDRPPLGYEDAYSQDFMRGHCGDTWAVTFSGIASSLWEDRQWRSPASEPQLPARGSLLLPVSPTSAWQGAEGALENGNELKQFSSVLTAFR